MSPWTIPGVTNTAEGDADVEWSYSNYGGNIDCDGPLGEGYVRWINADYTGDGVIDMLVDHNDCDTDMGSSHWLVYPGVCE